MKIKGFDPNFYVLLKTLEAGDTFELLGKYYIKTNCESDELISCVDITDGYLASIAKDKAVRPINVECVISYKEDEEDGISDNT